MTSRILISPVVVALAAAAPASASFTIINGFENWSAAAGPSTKLDFVFQQATVLSDQYAHLGVQFLSGPVAYALSSSFPQDGWGVKNAFPVSTEIRMKFDAPQYAIGAWFPGNLFADLYWQGELIYSSPGLYQHPLFYSFGGIISTLPFDEIVLYDGDGNARLDDLYFGNAIPAPGAAPLLFAALLAGGRRRRR